MRQLSVGVSTARSMFLGSLDGFVRAVADLSERELLDPSLCRGWSRLDLIVHVRLGLDEMAATAAVLTDRPPDHDAASYWVSRGSGEADPVPGILWLRRTASAYASPAGAAEHLRDAADRARRVVERAPDRSVLFQGKALTMGDFIATWVAELAIHQADLARPEPPAHIAFARATVESIADADLPRGLDDLEAVLIGLGRHPWPVETERNDAYPVRL